MKVIVFGGAGFLGSHVADALTAQGYDVTIFDIKPSPYLSESQKQVIGDILDEKAVADAVAGKNLVYNFAGIADIDIAHDDPVATVKSNILGNTIILDAAKNAKVDRFVFASSVYVYSQAGTFYRNSKEACELIIESYKKVYGLDYTILRYGSLYGPRSDDRNSIHNILKQALLEKKITRFGDGEEIREYIHVEDAARCSVDILKDDFKNQYVVLTGHQSIKIKDLLLMIREILGNEIEIEYLPSNADIHYNMTPYSFNPKIGKKFVSNYYLDMGQGLMNCLAEIYDTYLPHLTEKGILIKNDPDV